MVRRALWAVSACAAIHAVMSGLAGAAPVSPGELAQRIDRGIEMKWRANAVQAATQADDAEFARRVYLDVIGRIPRVSELRDFLADRAPDKRHKLVDKLLKTARHVQHFSTTWSQIILPPSNNQQLQFLLPGFRAWVEKQVREDVPYDVMVRELLTGSAPTAPAINVRLPQPAASPAAFYQANEQKPENLAAAASRIFLGIQVECAQCHDHPFASWKRDQFWEFAAFFSGVQAPGRFVPAQPVQLEPGRRIKIPETDRIVEARFLTGEQPRWKSNSDGRAVLAEWITSRDNTYFARTAVNRLWAHFFGIGLADPVDEEPTEDNPISHPELLDELSEQFIAHDFDVKYLVRAITASKTYQLSSMQTHPLPLAPQGRGERGAGQPRLFARMAIRGLTGEQLFDSLAAATGYQEPGSPTQARFIFNNVNTPRGEFINRFARQDKRTETQTSILQALAIMNGKLVADATSIERSTTLAAVADAPFMNTTEQVETLYLAALSRLPRPVEQERLVSYVESGGPTADKRKALADVFWAVLNSTEFIFNH